jgi:hypothetical protein
MLTFEQFTTADEQSIKRVTRVRGGQVQRRKKVAARPGYTVRGGKLVRMSAGERRARKMAQRKAARKRRSTIGRALRKRKVTLRKRKRLGL